MIRCVVGGLCVVGYRGRVFPGTVSSGADRSVLWCRRHVLCWSAVWECVFSFSCVVIVGIDYACDGQLTDDRRRFRVYPSRGIASPSVIQLDVILCVGW